MRVVEREVLCELAVTRVMEVGDLLGLVFGEERRRGYRVLGKMAERGLVALRPVPGDRRRRYAELAAGARPVLEAEGVGVPEAWWRPARRQRVLSILARAAVYAKLRGSGVRRRDIGPMAEPGRSESGPRPAGWVVRARGVAVRVYVLTHSLHRRRMEVDLLRHREGPNVAVYRTRKARNRALASALLGGGNVPLPASLVLASADEVGGVVARLVLDPWFGRRQLEARLRSVRPGLRFERDLRPGPGVMVWTLGRARFYGCDLTLADLGAALWAKRYLPGADEAVFLLVDSQDQVRFWRRHIAGRRVWFCVMGEPRERMLVSARTGRLLPLEPVGEAGRWVV